MKHHEFQTFLIVREAKAESTTEDLLRVLRRMERRGWNPDGSEDETAEFLVHQKTRGLSEYRKNVQVANAVFRMRGTPVKFPYPKGRRSSPKRLKPREIELMRHVGAVDPLEMLRDRAIVEFALQTGMRRSEVARFRAGDLDEEERTIHIPVPAKNGLVRTIPLDPEFLKPRGPFMSWLRARPVVKADPGAVWVRLSRGGGVMTPANVGNLMTQIGQRCGVRANFVRTRHTRATQLLQRGVHVRYLQMYLGHAKLDSTMVYLEADDHDLRREFDRVRGKR